MTTKLAALGAHPVRTSPFPIEDPILLDEEFHAVDSAIRSRCLSIFSSSEVQAFEEEFASYVGTNHAVAVTSGTAALHASLAAIATNGRYKVLVPVYTYAASVNAIYLAGLVPEFVDLAPDSPNLSMADASDRCSEDVTALLGVDLFGIPFDRDSAQALCAESGLTLVEDCAQSVGARWRDQPVGSFGIGCHSFGEIKNMTSAEGGMVTAADSSAVERVRAVRHAGEVWQASGRSTIGHYSSSIDELTSGMDYILAGHNYRMNSLQAALGRAQLKRLDDLNQLRSQHYATIAAAVQGVDGVSTFAIPEVSQPVANRCGLLLTHSRLSRRAVLYSLMAEGIPAGVYYPMLHSQTSVAAARGVHTERPFPNAQRVISSHVLVPCYPAMTPSDALDVAEAVTRVLRADLTEREVSDLEASAARARATYFGQFFTLA